MWAEPKLAGLCRGAGDIDAVAECAKRKFLNGWARHDGVADAPAPDRWVMPGACNPKGTQAQRKQTLRDLLRARLAARDPMEAVNQDAAPGSQITPTSTPDSPAAPSPPPLTDTDEAYCSYMARAVIRGELTPGSGAPIPPECKGTIAAAEALKAKQQKEGPPPFTMSDVETDREIARLLAPIATEPAPRQ